MNEQQAHLLEGTLQLLRNDQLITRQEFAIVCDLVGLFEHDLQSADAIAQKRGISPEEVERSLQDVLGKIKGHSNTVLRRLREVESLIKSVDDIAS